MDPFHDCCITLTSHLWDRANERNISSNDVKQIIRSGVRQRCKDNVYKIIRGKWIVVGKKYTCNIVVVTVFHGG